MVDNDAQGYDEERDHQSQRGPRGHGGMVSRQLSVSPCLAADWRGAAFPRLPSSMNLLMNRGRAQNPARNHGDRRQGPIGRRRWPLRQPDVRDRIANTLRGATREVSRDRVKALDTTLGRVAWRVAV